MFIHYIILNIYTLIYINIKIDRYLEIACIRKMCKSVRKWGEWLIEEKGGIKYNCWNKCVSDKQKNFTGLNEKKITV